MISPVAEGGPSSLAPPPSLSAPPKWEADGCDWQGSKLRNKCGAGVMCLCDVSKTRVSDEIGEVHGHLVNLCGVVLLDVTQDADIVCLDEVDL